MRCSTGIISISPWLDVKLVARVPVCAAPCTAAMAPASDCISTTVTGCPKTFFRPLADQKSVCSAIGDDGVMGYIAAISVNSYAIPAAASLPSSVTVFFISESLFVVKAVFRYGFFTHLVLEDLARGIHRESLDELDIPGHLVPGEPGHHV